MALAPASSLCEPDPRPLARRMQSSVHRIARPTDPTMPSNPVCVGQTVDFDVHDAFLPTPAEVLMQRHGHQILQGQVMDLTPAGAPGGDYAVLRVRGVRDFVIVPRERVRPSLLGRTG
jgi:hypothetical protein